MPRLLEFFRPVLLSLVTVVSAAFVACGKAPPPAAPVVAAPVEVDAKEMTLEEMTTALEAWFTSRGSAPKNFQEMIKAGFIKKMPTPPAGKDFAIDATNLRVVLVDRLLGN